MSYAAFEAEMARLNDVLCTVNLLAWDARTVMPHGGVQGRGHQVATLTTIARDIATGDAMRRALDGARREVEAAPVDDIRRRAVDAAERDIAILARVPAPLVTEIAQLKTVAHAAWAEARAASDFARFAPTLSRMMDLQRRLAECVGGGDHPYDALLGMFEPGMTLARLTPIFTQLRDAIVPLIAHATSAPQPRTDFLRRSFPIAEQKAFSLTLAERMGYDLSRGRLDDTVHPFEISFTRGDVRITSRFREDWLPGGMFALWHEAGHGMYEQGIAPAFTRTIFATDIVNLYAVGGTSFAMHESQSRMWENRVGRSRRFWDMHFPDLQATFPAQLSDVTADAFWRAVNQVRPDFIRVEADELTYDMHIILRTEVESALMAQEIEVQDLPAVWRDKMETYLGVTVKDDRLGVLQDVHWSHGLVGSFPTYTLGNVMASQLFSAALRASGVDEGLAGGNYAPLSAWLSENVHRHGRSASSDEILRRATGRGLDPAPYIADLCAKVAALTD